MKCPCADVAPAKGIETVQKPIVLPRWLMSVVPPTYIQAAVNHLPAKISCRIAGKSHGFRSADSLPRHPPHERWLRPVRQ